MSDRTDKDRQEEQAQAFDSLAAATAVGFAVASRSMEVWFGMMSGFARASREMLAPHLEAQLRDMAQAEQEFAPVATKEDDRVVELAPRRRKAAAEKVEAVKVAPATVDRRAPKAIARPETIDDLKRVSGIGPKLEQVLNGVGLWTYAQLADLQAEEIAWLDETLGLNGRIDADNWLEQAETLARTGMQKKDVAAG